jgi:hypothetical protein
MEAVYVGIDVSKERLDVHVRPGGVALRLRASAKAWKNWSNGCGRCHRN